MLLLPLTFYIIPVKPVLGLTGEREFIFPCSFLPVGTMHRVLFLSSVFLTN